MLPVDDLGSDWLDWPEYAGLLDLPSDVTEDVIALEDAVVRLRSAPRGVRRELQRTRVRLAGRMVAISEAVATAERLLTELVWRAEESSGSVYLYDTDPEAGRLASLNKVAERVPALLRLAAILFRRYLAEHLARVRPAVEAAEPPRRDIAPPAPPGRLLAASPHATNGPPCFAVAASMRRWEAAA